MQTDYFIEDLIYQTPDLVVYRVMTEGGTPLALTRLNYRAKILRKLKNGVFESGLTQLQDPSHPCLRNVIDGGLDPIDGAPWIVTSWWDGISLTNRFKESGLTAGEIVRIKSNSEALISALGPHAPALAFLPDSVITCYQDDQPIDTFQIDYHSWFTTIAKGGDPKTEGDPHQKLKALLLCLRKDTSNTLPPPVSLASAKSSGFPIKFFAGITVLIVILTAISWQFTKKSRADAEAKSIAALNIEEEQSNIIKRKKIRKVGPSDRLADRSLYTIIDPSNDEQIKKNIGRWVSFEGELSSIGGDERLIPAGSNLRISIPPGSSRLGKICLRNKAVFWGYLESEFGMRIVNPDDLEVIFLPKDIYTVEDESQIRKTLLGKNKAIKVRAIGTYVDKSFTGRTLYLHFKNAKPAFVASVEKSIAAPSLDRAYLESLVGKKIIVDGIPRKLPKFAILRIVVTDPSQITIVE